MFCGAAYRRPCAKKRYSGAAGNDSLRLSLAIRAGFFPVPLVSRRGPRGRQPRCRRSSCRAGSGRVGASCEYSSPWPEHASGKTCFLPSVNRLCRLPCHRLRHYHPVARKLLLLLDLTREFAPVTFQQLCPLGLSGPAADGFTMGAGCATRVALSPSRDVRCREFAARSSRRTSWPVSSQRNAR